MQKIQKTRNRQATAFHFNTCVRDNGYCKEHAIDKQAKYDRFLPLLRCGQNVTHLCRLVQVLTPVLVVKKKKKKKSLHMPF